MSLTAPAPSSSTFATAAFEAPSPRARLPPPYADEAAVLRRLAPSLDASLAWPAVLAAARPWVQAVRDHPAPFWAMESLLREYPISSAEGLALMRLAEALLRVPDAETAIALTADQLGRAEFEAGSGGAHQLLANLSASAIALSKKFLPGAESEPGLLKRLGAKTVVAATVRAIQLLGRQFVLGRSIDEAMAEAASARQAQASLRFSYDMLGEGARTEADAQRYLASYLNAIGAIAAGNAGRGGSARPDAATGTATAATATSGPEHADGISIKLSALFSRYEDAQRDRVFAELLPRVWQLVGAAAGADINLTIDAEESDRLELSLDVFEALAERIAARFPAWRGFGLAVQAYQTRALAVVDEVARIARRLRLRFMVRLVKGAYWDGEIKRAQEGGLAGYPVFTRKTHTDVSYLACAQALLGHTDVVYPQFATHNAGTIAAILQMGAAAPGRFELQRLHGMGEGVYREVSRYTPAGNMTTTPPAPPAQAGGLMAPVPGRAGPGTGAAAAVPVRVYAPVGEHRDLLAYLVRRLLENGANSSFVHQLSDEAVPIDVLLASPLVASLVSPLTSSQLSLPASASSLLPTMSSSAAASLAPFDGAGGTAAPFEPAIAPPAALYGGGRANSKGVDLAVIAEREPLLRAVAATVVAPVTEAAPTDIATTMARLQTGFAAWSARPLATRAAVLRRAADALEARLPAFCGLLVKEAQKTLGDCVAEVREAVDFCRYYADMAESTLQPQLLPGPTGERNELRLHGRGVFVCISPWNFPLAIFTGQVVAALVAGNAVAAKPAEQTPAVAARMVALLHDAGVPADALALLHGPGETIGAALVADARAAGVCFTGSTAVAKAINRALAAKDGPIVPLIAETGGINAMVVDSSALPEQVVDAVVQSAFRSAGQRCSALRLLCVHEAVADAVIEMIRGALAELRIGDPALLATDVGPVIDDEAFAGLSAHVERLQRTARFIGAAPPAPARSGGPGGAGSAGNAAHAANVESGGHFVTPVAFEVDAIADVRQEVFGPVLHVVRWGPGQRGGGAAGDVDAVIAQINALGYGLTLGIQTRIDSRALRLAQAARIGNVYVNRNIIGAVVGVQPFGGEGLSGTGPKAGGPHYLLRFCVEQTLTINTAAAGGNVDLMTS